uniref:Uncharacterized protein n=1 Tax=Manihot esculenta TaxID=3983 RepID=A0A2C9U3P4_MANES
MDMCNYDRRAGLLILLAPLFNLKCVLGISNSFVHFTFS